jgi:hypothetical protein
MTFFSQAKKLFWEKSICLLNAAAKKPSPFFPRVTCFLGKKKVNGLKKIS